MSKEIYQDITERIVEALERGVVPWRRPWAVADDWPKNLDSGANYRGINIWLTNGHLLGVTVFKYPLG